jgi:hypothetical protein
MTPAARSTPTRASSPRKKANNARLGETVKLRWQKGLFVPEATLPNHFRRPVEDVFLALLDAVTTEGQTVSPKSKASNYAPALFMKRLPNERDDYQRADFERALQALFQRQKIKIATYGRASWNYEKIVRAEPDEHDQ